MNIYKLEINCLRGIKNLVLEFKGKNAVIYGDNGTGKSGVIDAIDFLLHGSILRISGESMKEVSLSAHGKHVTEDIKDAWVSAEIRVPEFKETFKITRRLTRPKQLECDEKYKDVMSKIASIAEMKAHFLSRREILKYINSTDGDRAKAIENLLNLDTISKSRAMLMKLQREHEDLLVQEKKALATIEENINLKLAVSSSVDWLDSINILRSSFGAFPLESYEDENILKNINFSKNEQVLSKKNLLLQTSQNIINLISSEGGLLSLLQKFIDKLKKIAEYKDLQKYLTRLNLYKAGLTTAEDNCCPLCNQPIDTAQLLNTLKEKIEQLSVFEEIKKDKENILNAIKDKITTITNIYNQTKQQDISIERIYSEIDKILKFKNCLTEEVDRVKVEEFASTIQLSVLESFSDELHKEIVSLSLGTLQRTYNTLVDVGGLLKEYFKKAQIVKNEVLAGKRISSLAINYSKAQEDWLNNLYKSIESDFSAYYRKMHQADEGNFNGVLKKSGAQLSLRVDFFDGNKYPPNAVHSEGHQDSMGICLFFALSKKIANNDLNLILLDDVVMSIDIDHRISFCNLLKEVFPNKQFIITTHDYIWRTELEQQHIVEPQNVFYFKAWDITKGPLLAKSNDIWERIEDDLSAGNKNEAAYLLRYYLEEYLAEICNRYRLLVPYSNTARWSLEEKFNPVHKFFKDALNLAKQSLISYNKDTSRIDGLIQKYEKCFQALNADKWIMNPSTHYTDWAKNISITELYTLSMATKNYCECLKCEQCKKALFFTEVQNGKPKQIVCDCGEYMFSCIKRKE